MAKKPTAGGSLPTNFDPTGRTTDDAPPTLPLKPTGAWAALMPAPPAPPPDPTAGDNTTKYAADQAALTRRGATVFGGIADDGNDADVLGSSGAGVKRRAASRALLG